MVLTWDSNVHTTNKHETFAVALVLPVNICITFAIFHIHSISALYIFLTLFTFKGPDRSLLLGQNFKLKHWKVQQKGTFL